MIFRLFRLLLLNVFVQARLPYCGPKVPRMRNSYCADSVVFGMVFGPMSQWKGTQVGRLDVETQRTSFFQVERGSFSYQTVERVAREAEHTGAENKKIHLLTLEKESTRGKAGRPAPSFWAAVSIVNLEKVYFIYRNWL